METIILEPDIIDKLKDDFHVSQEEINCFYDFFKQKIKPEIRTHYLSHLVSSIEELVNNQKKEELLKHIKEERENNSNLRELIQKSLVRLFSIRLYPLNNFNGLKVSRKALTCVKEFEIRIYYLAYLEEYEKRFIIAHELGHIVDKYLLKNENTNNMENRASLFAYIALLDRDDFYKKYSKDYTYKSDIALYEDYLNLVHNKRCIKRVGIKN